ncbi:hypothetical protein ACMFMG_006691 [Clarireedia jacksonii]
MEWTWTWEERHERGKKAFILNIPDPSIFGDLFSSYPSILHLTLLRGLERIGKKKTKVGTEPEDEISTNVFALKWMKKFWDDNVVKEVKGALCQSMLTACQHGILFEARGYS